MRYVVDAKAFLHKRIESDRRKKHEETDPESAGIGSGAGDGAAMMPAAGAAAHNHQDGTWKKISEITPTGDGRICLDSGKYDLDEDFAGSNRIVVNSDCTAVVCLNGHDYCPNPQSIYSGGMAVLTNAKGTICNCTGHPEFTAGSQVGDNATLFMTGEFDLVYPGTGYSVHKQYRSAMIDLQGFKGKFTLPNYTNGCGYTAYAVNCKCAGC